MKDEQFSINQKAKSCEVANRVSLSCDCDDIRIPIFLYTVKFALYSDVLTVFRNAVETRLLTFLGKSLMISAPIH